MSFLETLLNSLEIMQLLSLFHNHLADNGVPFVQRWVEIINQARQSVEYLKALDVVRAVLNILQVSTVQHLNR